MYKVILEFLLPYKVYLTQLQKLKKDLVKKKMNNLKIKIKN